MIHIVTKDTANVSRVMRDPAELIEGDVDDGFDLPYCGSLKEEGIASSSLLDGNCAV